MKVTLEYNLPEETSEYEDAMNGTKYKIALDEAWNIVFRPGMKHGYYDERLNKLLESKHGQYIYEKLKELYLQATEGVRN